MRNRLQKRLREKRIFSFFLCAVVLFSFFSATAADVNAQSIQAYVNEGWMRFPMPATYEFLRVINNVGDEFEGEPRFFNNPQGFFVGADGNLYIADTGNNRIVKMTPEGETLAIFRGPANSQLHNPQGIFVHSSLSMYIADTGNSRIVHLCPAGHFVEQFVLPESDLLGDNRSFAVTQLVVSDIGFIYVIRGESIMIIDGYNQFRGFLGQVNIGFNLVETLIRILGSEQQQSFIARRYAPAFTNLALDSEGMILASSRDNNFGEIKRLNSVGNNIFREYTGLDDEMVNPIYRFIRDFIRGTGRLNPTFRFGERRTDNFEPMLPIFADIAVDANGIVTVVESQTGRIYQYDQMGHLITVFGGAGEQRGAFRTPTAIEKDAHGNIFVLDSATANVQIFRPTEFVQLIHTATNHYAQGRYDEAYHYWTLVLNQHENYRLAHRGIANAFYKRGYMQESMTSAMLAQDRGLYSRAFDEFRYEVFRAHFFWIILAIVLASYAFIKLVQVSMRKARTTNDRFIKTSHDMGVFEGFMISLYGAFRPIDAFETIRYNKSRLNMITPIIILAAAVIVRIAFVYTVHFPLQRINPQWVNPVMEVFGVLLLPLSWVIAAFAVTSVFDGETKPREIFFTAAMSMLPFILIHLPFMFLSHVLSGSELTMFRFFVAASYVWCFILFFTSLRELNDFSFRKNVAMMIVIFFTMVLIWLVSLMVYVLVGRLVQFSLGLYNEALLTWF